MKQCRKLPLCLMGFLMLSLNASLVAADTSGHPYTGIAARNIFGLGPLVARSPDPPPAASPKIMLVGITTLVQDKRALLKVEFPAQPPEPAKEVSCILTVGQRVGPIEVLAIDESAGTVRVNNSGTEMVLSFASDGPRKQGSAPVAASASLPHPPIPPVQ
jgi:hypothetical protein